MSITSPTGSGFLAESDSSISMTTRAVSGKMANPIAPADPEVVGAWPAHIPAPGLLTFSSPRSMIYALVQTSILPAGRPDRREGVNNFGDSEGNMNTTSRQHDYAVFIGRFEPFHNAHKRVIDKALSVADKVIVLIGSANKPRSIKDPFFVDERQVMIRSSFPAHVAKKMIFGELRDFPYSDDRWMREVQAQVSEAIAADNLVLNSPKKVCIVGHFKDSATDYLRMFPQWKLVDAPNHEQRSATDLRTLMFDAASNPADAVGKWTLVQSAVPDGVHAFLQEFAKGSAFAQLVKEHGFVKGYKAQFAALLYPPIFCTVDAVVVHSGHILLVKRGAEPGKGLWALPGGFVNQNEYLLDACMRELREETRLKIPEPVLRGSIKAQRVFDRPDRSTRGRTITHAYYFDFPTGDLPQVKGGDDAVKAKWMPLAEFFEFAESSMFEDHFGIITAFLGV